MMVKISILSPVYKTETHLEKTIGSVLAQTFADWELILVDNGGSDQCPQICDAFAKQDARIKVVHLPENVGIGGARNVGLRHAQGEFIQFMDSDDLLDPCMCEKLYAAIQKQHADMAICRFDILYSDGHADSIPSPPTEFYDTPLNTHQVIELISEMPLLWSALWVKLFRRSFLEDHQSMQFDTAIGYADDVIFATRLLTHAPQIVLLPDVLYHWIQHGTNTSKTSLKLEESKLFYTAYIDLISELYKKYPELITEKIPFMGEIFTFLRYITCIVRAEIPFGEKLNAIQWWSNIHTQKYIFEIDHKSENFRKYRFYYYLAKVRNPLLIWLGYYLSRWLVLLPARKLPQVYPPSKNYF